MLLPLRRRWRRRCCGCCMWLARLLAATDEGLALAGAKVVCGQGLPSAFVLCFYLERGLEGLWEGQILISLSRQAFLLYFSLTQDWAALAAKVSAAQSASRSTQEERQRLTAADDKEGEEDGEESDGTEGRSVYAQQGLTPRP